MPLHDVSPGGGHPQLLYRNVLGAAAASIDTGAASISGLYDILEIFLYGRTDEAVAQSTVSFTFNNDSAANYDRVRLRDINTTVTGAVANAASAAQGNVAGASCTTSVFSSLRIVIPAYSLTTAFKSGELISFVPDQTAGNTMADVIGFQWRSTAAITRVAVAPATAAKNFLTGTALYIYGR